MRTLAKICRWVGQAWIVLAVCVILLGYISIWYFQGWSALQEIASPFNLWNFAAIVITIAPGLVLLRLGDYLNERIDARQ